MAKKLLGLEIGNTNIKLMEVKKKGTICEIINAILMPTPNDAIKEGRIVDQKGLYELIKEALDSHKIRTKDICILIQGPDIITRDALIEAENEKHLEALLKVKVSEYLPIEISEYQVDYKILKTIEEEGKKKFSILLVAAPNKMILPVVSLMTKLKLRPNIISIPLNAIGRMFDEHLGLLEVKTQTNLIIDLGGKSTTLSIVKDGEGILNKEVPFGLEDVNELIMLEFGSKNLKETEVFKKAYGAIYELEDEKDEDNDKLDIAYSEREAYRLDGIYGIDSGYKLDVAYDVEEENKLDEAYGVEKDYELDASYTVDENCGLDASYAIDENYGLEEPYAVDDNYGLDGPYTIDEAYRTEESYKSDVNYGGDDGALVYQEEATTGEEMVNQSDKEHSQKDEDFYGHYISNIIRPKIDRQLISEINRFIQFYYSRGKNPPIQAIYLIGGGANLKNIEHYLETSINLPTYKTLISKSIKVKEQANFEENSLYFINLLGLISGI